jgi:hypothetical protein
LLTPRDRPSRTTRPFDEIDTDQLLGIAVRELAIHLRAFAHLAITRAITRAITGAITGAIAAAGRSTQDES